MAGALVVTARATTLALAHWESIAAMRSTHARTAMIFAARSEPRATVLICVWERDRFKLCPDKCRVLLTAENEV